MAISFDPAAAFGSGGLSSVENSGSNGLSGQTVAPISSIGTPVAQPSADPYGNIAKLLAASQASTNALLAKYQTQTYAPNLDFASINSRARAQAENAVNPYYTKQLTDFLTQQGVQKAQTQAQSATDIQNLKDTLTNTLQGNDITGARTTQDVAQNEAQINQTADQFQTDSGQKFATDRLALAKASSGGGLGAQTEENAQLARDTTEKRQEQTFQQNRDAQELSKARTFEDLARSGAQATTGEAKGEKQSQVDLANFIQNQGLDLTTKQNQLETQKQSDILAKSKEVSGTLVQNFINSISNPAQRQAALQAYGGLI